MKHCITLFICLIPLLTQAQTNTWRFDLGNGAVAAGYTGVTTTTFYNEQTGYGFEPGASLRAINRKGKDLLRSDGITSDGPFLFSVKLPEGNYNVTVTLGDADSVTVTSIRAECRRLMVPQVTTKKGQFAWVSFTVHVRDSLIARTNNKVKLKPREINYLHWDNKLTLEFNDAHPGVCAIEITPAQEVVTVFLAGNSTVVDQAEEPYAAWGQMIPAFFQPGKVAIANYAESGEALHSFISARRLEKVLSLMKPGDYLFIEFGHNDQKQKGEGIGPFTSYKRNLQFFIAETRKKGGIPVLITSMHRRSFDSTGKIVNTLGDYPAAVRQTAAEEGVALIDLNNMSQVLYEAWGPDKSQQAFVIYPANTFPGQDKELKDNTHFNPYGAYEIARCILQGIRDNQLPLARYSKKEITSFNPAHPDDITQWHWPLSRRMNMVKPDGN
ncbi:rhamnogalacturonan acetylesterase [Paraflavitalea speifideaquila]|uniref:rhamnogalacturonan acetylesterase n=1 Tax=Paraflavitalea speifideaquila TaxID=3076558 RepID=UPI0028E91698|nr:GDSL-type esterase/lipase family protein [Paraflavitalea speifideiaquila]